MGRQRCQAATLFLCWDHEGISQEEDSVVSSLFRAVDEGTKKEKGKKKQTKRKRSSSSSASRSTSSESPQSESDSESSGDSSSSDSEARTPHTHAQYSIYSVYIQVRISLSNLGPCCMCHVSVNVLFTHISDHDWLAFQTFFLVRSRTC